MGIQHAFRIARRARGVAQAGGGLLREARPHQFGAVLRQQGFVIHRIRQGRLRHLIVVDHDDKTAYRGELIGHRFQQFGKTGIQQYIAVFCVLNNVLNLLRIQTWIHGMTNRSQPGNCVIAFKMPVTVPGQCCHAITGFHPQRQQRISQLFTATQGITIGITMNIAFQAATDDFPVAMMCGGVFQ